MRKLFVACFITLLLYACAEPASTKNDNNEIATGSLAEAGMDSTLIDKLDNEISQGVFPNIHSLLIMRNNKCSEKENSFSQLSGVD